MAHDHNKTDNFMIIPVDESFIQQRNQTERELLSAVKANTPQTWRTPLFPQDETGEFSFFLDAGLIDRLNLWDWFRNYKRESQASTGGIRGPQNVLYPWDMRFPINQMGVVLATLGKSLVANENSKGRQLKKIAGCEVRYNSKKYVELISRIQAAQGIQTLVTRNLAPIPIWMVSFLIFILDLDGGEHVTSSHSVSTKTATKDLNNQGSQYLSEESLQFVNKIEKILKTAESEGYSIQFSALNDDNIDFSLIDRFDGGVSLYVDYLRNGVANDANLNLIRKMKPPIVIDCVGGCMYQTMRRIFERLKVADTLKWLHVEADPLYYNIGKLDYNPKSGETEYFDLGCDFSILEVVKTADYATKLKNEPIGTVIEVTDPDGDRLIVCEIEPVDRKCILERIGIEFLDLGNGRILSIFTPNQSFLMNMDFYANQLKTIGVWEAHPRFIIKTTPSAIAWDEWALRNGVSAVNVPVGFKEIAAVIKKVERQMSNSPDEPVVVKDIFGESINLGVQPRLLFGGEESGGMITGPEELIRSRNGRTGIAMREKSAGESMVLVAALAAHCKAKRLHLSEYLERLYTENSIVGKYDIREDVVYYNESEPDPAKLKRAKLGGEMKRDRNDLFFLGLAISRHEERIGLNQVRVILEETFPSLDFSDLEGVRFVGDGTYFKFRGKFVEIRKSGTDAKTKAYASGNDKRNCRQFAEAFGNYGGELTASYRTAISDAYLSTVEEKAREIYRQFQLETV
ncbi:MAG: hypothetical protein OXN17_11500 [Candidatus Poribacteria bacterium]|nr:hypothetical protein [Candidatus Poribacteria bacterium]